MKKKHWKNGENTGKMQKILEKFMKKYWKNAKKTGKVREIRQSKKVGTMYMLTCPQQSRRRHKQQQSYPRE